jgi:hypothetical protein
VVNFVFKHLVDQGLHPTLGEAGHPGEPAAALLRAMGITPTQEGDARIANDVRQQLADLRAVMFEDPVSPSDRSDRSDRGRRSGDVSD